MAQSTQAGDDVSQSDQQSINMSLMFGQKSDSGQQSVLNMQQLCGETIDVEEAFQQSEIVAQEIVSEPEANVVEGPKLRIDPLKPLEKFSNFSEPMLSTKVRFFRDEDSKQFRQRNLVFRIGVSIEGEKEDYQLFESQQINLVQFVRSHLVEETEKG